MPARTSASPSPPPQAPIATAPGPRATALQKVFSGALSSSLKANSYANFSACFPTPAKYCPTALEGVWKQLNSRLEEECTKDFEKIMGERSVIEGLNQWDALMEDARRRKNRAIDGEQPGRPPHTLAGDELYTAHLIPFLQTASNELQGRLDATQQENQNIMRTIEVQRAEIEKLVAGLEGVVQDIEGSIAALNVNDHNSGVASLRDEAWKMEQEVAASK
jgi:kinetochore protein NNF1